MSGANLLVELQVEELPPKSLQKLGDAFAGELARGLRERDFAGADAAVTAYASPRRLAVHVGGVRATSPARDVVEKLMPASVGIGADGLPTAALRKRLEKSGRGALADAWSAASAMPEGLFVASDGKADAVHLRTSVAGVALGAGLQGALDDAIARLPIPKVMRYQLADGWTSVDFVRPAHGLVALHGAEVVGVGALGLRAGRVTRGHRFEAAVPLIELRDADSYAEQLRDEGAVIASYTERRAEIARQLDAAAGAAGSAAIDDAALLDEVTGLVERPHVLACLFDAEYLAVPPECLVLTMKANQKYFPLLDRDGKLTNRFLVVANVSPADPGRVVEGNERVVRPRLADAKFFYDQDRRKTLESRVAGLDRIVYHNRLGSQGDRTRRVRAIARSLAEAAVESNGVPDTGFVERVDTAARLAKADLLTDMVGEFPELQGVMGRRYALHDGHPAEVAAAIEDHYRPRYAGDALPANGVGAIVALADKLETLTGLFGIGQVPTGDRDPYALRRQAIGAIRLLMARADLGLAFCLDAAARAFDPGASAAPAGLRAFIDERLAGMMAEAGYTRPECDAVLAGMPDRLGEVPRRLAAVRAFAAMAEAPALAAANKRVTNILKQSAAAAGAGAAAVDPARLVEPEEGALFDAVERVGADAGRRHDAGDYAASLAALAALKAPVDAFFDRVMVNADDPGLRANRLALLGRLRAEMNRVADLSRLV